MKGRNKSKKEKDIRHYIALVAILVSVMLLFTVYSVCKVRLLYALVDFGISFAYYVLFIFDMHYIITPTVNTPIDVDINNYLPFSLSEIEFRLNGYWERFFNLENFIDYIISLVNSLNLLCVFLTGVVPAVCLLAYAVFSRYTSEHLEDEENSRFKRFVLVLSGVFRKISDTYKWFSEYYSQHKVYIGVFVFIWLINTNILTLIVEFFAYYFYLVVSFDILSLGTQFLKLVYDVIIMLWTLPIVLWTIIGYIIFDKIRKSIAFDKLRHMEAKNRGFDNSLPICTMAIGSMGVGKTKTIVDMALSLQNEFRDRAVELMGKNMMRFSHFDFHSFEITLKEKIVGKRIFNLASAREYVRHRRKEYEAEPSSERLWGYDVNMFPRYYNNGLTVVDIWKMLENYAQEYFIYTMTTSLIISNLAIRSDVDIIDEGYFKDFNQDFFDRAPEKVNEYSAYSHIIDFDLFRIGCQMNKENAIAGSFEFGIIVVTEIGKERQNSLELKEVKKKTDEANQKNDLFNSWLKMIRHAGTVEGYCFVRFICDEQRASSWGADARDLVSLVDIRSISECKMSLPLCILPQLFISNIYPKYQNWYKRVKIYGNENCFFVSSLHGVFGRVYRACERKCNIFGYYTEEVTVRSGNLDEEVIPEEHKYYLMTKKIYSDRYSTDCFKDTFAKRALEAGTSLYEIPTYASSCATLEELKMQNSYMANTFIAMYSKKHE